MIGQVEVVMFNSKARMFSLILLGSAAAVTLAGCESSGGVRLASVGGQGGVDGAGSTGDGSGSGTDTGSDGSGSGTGTGSSGSGSGSGGTGSGGTGGTGNGSQSGSGLLSTIAVPGVVGSNGVADTGLLANTGNPSNPGVVGAVLVTAGNAALGANAQTPALVQLVDNAVPGSVPIAGTVSQVLGATGQALVDTGQGKTYLVDGLTAAVGEAVSLNVLNKNVLPGSGTQLIGASVLSTTQNTGTLATVGVDAAGKLVNAAVTPLGAGNATAVNAVVPGTTAGLRNGAGQQSGHAVNTAARRERAPRRSSGPACSPRRDHGSLATSAVQRGNAATVSAAHSRDGRSATSTATQRLGGEHRLDRAFGWRRTATAPCSMAVHAAQRAQAYCRTQRPDNDDRQCDDTADRRCPTTRRRPWYGSDRHRSVRCAAATKRLGAGSPSGSPFFASTGDRMKRMTPCWPRPGCCSSVATIVRARRSPLILDRNRADRDPAGHPHHDDQAEASRRSAASADRRRRLGRANAASSSSSIRFVGTERARIGGAGGQPYIGKPATRANLQNIAAAISGGYARMPMSRCSLGADSRPGHLPTAW
jgi:hypothetical protein